MNNKYQIFVSSTYVDLKEQRDLVIKAILEMGHIPVGMEMFSAADEEQWEIIKRQIDQSDYYVVILANRYGSVSSSGVSYTEMEYDYAVSKGIPALGFILEHTTAWPTSFTDRESIALAGLTSFKEKVKRKHVSFWKSTDDLYGKCSIALMKSFTAYPREGWVRASAATNLNMSVELARLSAENAMLRETLQKVEAQEKIDHDNETEKVFSLLKRNQQVLSVWLKGTTKWKNHGEITLLKVFRVLAPELLVEKSISAMSRYAAPMLTGLMLSKFRDTYPVPSNQIKGWMVDFATLELVTPSNKKKPIIDKEEYWTLTNKGRDLLNRIRRAALENVLVEPENITSPVQTMQKKASAKKTARPTTN